MCPPSAPPSLRFRYFWFPLLYVSVVPVLNVFKVAMQDCWKELGKMRFMKIEKKLARQNTRHFQAQPNNYVGVTSLKDEKGAKKKIAPAQDGVNAHKKKLSA